MSFTAYRKPALAPELQPKKSAFAFWVALGIIGGIVAVAYLAGAFS